MSFSEFLKEAEMEKGPKRVPEWILAKMKSLDDKGQTHEWVEIAKVLFGEAPLGLILQALADSAESTAKEFEKDSEPESQKITKDYQNVSRSLKGLITKLDPEMEWEPEYGGSGE